MSALAPAMPIADIRFALDAHDWERASALLSEHDSQMRLALTKIDVASTDLAPWRALLQTQHELLEELIAGRDEAAEALARLHRDQRGTRAYQEMR